MTLDPAVLAALAPWGAVALAWLCLLALLLRPAGSEALRRQMVEMDQGLRREIAAGIRDSLSVAFDRVQQGNEALRQAQAQELEGVGRLLREGDERGRRDMEALGGTLREEQERLRAMIAERLEDMRATVDEKLHAALEKQVGESFRRVTEQFAEVQQAIGAVRGVVAQVGDLKRLFSNVKARGGWGEQHLEALLEDALPGGYVRNLRPTEGSGEAVEFALRVPVKGAEIWLPIDAKFPTEDYDRLLLAAEAGRGDDEAAARRGLERTIRDAAARIARYVVPPVTVEFAVMYVPSDGLFGEIARIPGLIEQLRREHRVMVMGPSLLPAFLHTIRVGHLTVALERKAVEIGETLGAVKQEWGRLDGALKVLAERAEQVSRGIEDTRKRARIVGGKLRGVAALDGADADRLLGLDARAFAADPGEQAAE